LTEIVGVPCPEPFAELWRSDLRKWFLSLDPPTEPQAAAVIAGLKMFPKNKTPAASPAAEPSN
jgi:hypothetical protein